MKFVLKQYDTELISFDLWSRGPGGSLCTSLRFMGDFRFTRDRNYNLPAKRLKTLEAFLQRRTRKLSAGEK